MNMRNIWMFPVLMLVILACTKKDGRETWKVSLHGKVNNPGAGSITIKGWNDTTNVEHKLDFNPADSTFSGELEIAEPGFYRINFFGQQLVDVVLDHARLEVNVDGNSQMGFAEVKGSPDVELLRRVEEVRQRFQESPEVEDLNRRFAAAVSAKDEGAVSDLREEYQAAMTRNNDSIAEVLFQAAPSLGVINLINGNVIDRDRHFDDILRIAGKFSGPWATYSPVKDFLTAVEQMKVTAIGQPAPEIALPDPQGKVIKLSSFRGKFVLVDFWAKWCGPCRAENPNLVKAYKKFKGDKFEVIGVSLDRSKADWLRAIEEDQLEWVHISDLQYFDSQAARDYNISAIPYSILVNPEGVIVAKNLRGSVLHKTLEEFLKKGS